MKSPPFENVLIFVAMFLASMILASIVTLYKNGAQTHAPIALRSPAPAAPIPRPITTLNYFPAPCHAQATHHDHAYEWLCPNGDVYRTPLTF